MRFEGVMGMETVSGFTNRTIITTNPLKCRPPVRWDFVYVADGMSRQKAAT